MKYTLCAIILLCAASTSFTKDESINSNVVNAVVDRRVDISSHVVKITSDVTFVNNGNSGVSTYLLSVPLLSHTFLAFIGASRKDGTTASLDVSRVNVANHENAVFYGVKLPSMISPGKSVKLSIEIVFTHFLQPFPVEIVQAEKQFVVYEDILHFYSPYTTTKQSSSITTTTASIEFYTKIKPTSVRENTISYGPYNDVKPFSEEKVRVHYENNSPFLTITELVRLIEVSHWGNIAIEEHIDIFHSGAKLKGPFSRYHYQRSNDGVSSVRSFKTILPASAKDVYYRDEIGNISTSNMREMDDAVEVELRPRFPLFGGWKTHYYIGYNVPSYEYLYSRGDQYILKMRFVDHVIQEQIVDKITIKVILPEGSSNIEVRTPYPVKREKDEMHYTYLDTVGRPVVIVSKTNLVEQHIADFRIEYTFNKLRMLQEPVLVVAAFYILCIMVIIYIRLDFSIVKDDAKESRLRIASLLDEVRSLQDRRSALHQSYDDAIQKYKMAKDSSGFRARVKKIDNDHRALSHQLDGIISQLKEHSTDVADKVSELQRLESSYKDQLMLAQQYAEKVVSNKISRQLYEENDNATKAKRAEIFSKVETLLENL